MINFSLTLLYIATVIVIVSTPGPVVMLVINSSLKGGFAKGIRTIAGTNLSSLILMFVAILTIYGIISINHVFLNFLRLFGCLYLIYIAIQSIIDTKHNALSPSVKESGGFLKGFYVGLSNPKDIIFFASLFPQFIFISPTRWVGLSLLSGVWVTIDWMILIAYVTLLSQFIDGKYKEKIIIVSSCLLLAIGVIGIAKSVIDFI